MKIALLGYGIQNAAGLEYWDKPENQITICDQSQVTVPEGFTCRFGDDYLQDLDQYDLLVRIPSLHPKDIVEANPNSPHILEKVTTVTNEFFKVCPSKNIIGVTGTKGKGTTSTLITKLLQASGKTVHLGGNIGIAPLAMLKDNIQPTDWVVLELANFQLIDIKFSPKIAVCLMVVPEHMDWHSNMEEYVVAKQQLFLHQTVHDLAVFNRGNAYSQQIAGKSAGSKISYAVPVTDGEPQKMTGAYVNGNTIYMDDTAVCQTEDVALLGRHNLENVCAALATTWELIGHDVQLFKQVVSQFKGLEHRLELVRQVGDVKYYNDSFAATPEAAMAAINAISGQKLMILGGYDRNLSLESLAHTIVSHRDDIRKVLLIGASAKRLGEALSLAGYDSYEIVDTRDITEIVALAASSASPKSSVILSPGFASFDMFRNFEDRGLQYKNAVKEL